MNSSKNKRKKQKMIRKGHGNEPTVIEFNLSKAVLVCIIIITLITTITAAKVITTIIEAKTNNSLANTDTDSENVNWVESTHLGENGEVIIDTNSDGTSIKVPVPKGFTASKIPGETSVNTGFVIYEGDIDWSTILVENNNEINEQVTNENKLNINTDTTTNSNNNTDSTQDEANGTQNTNTNESTTNITGTEEQKIDETNASINSEIENGSQINRETDNKNENGSQINQETDNKNENDKTTNTKNEIQEGTLKTNNSANSINVQDKNNEDSTSNNTIQNTTEEDGVNENNTEETNSQTNSTGENNKKENGTTGNNTEKTNTQINNNAQGNDTVGNNNTEETNSKTNGTEGTNQKENGITGNNNTEETNTQTNNTKPNNPQGNNLSENNATIDTLSDGTITQQDINIFNLQKSTNQYVWIPVKDISRIYGVDNNKKLYGKLYEYSNTGRTLMEENSSNYAGVEPGLANVIETDNLFLRVFDGKTTDEVLFKELEQSYYETIKSIKEYGGFFIGRYETGGISGNAVVRKMNTDLGSQTWYTIYEKIKSLKGTNEHIETQMIWGSLWDEVLMWFIESGATISDGTTLNYSLISTDSTSWGNYLNSEFNYISKDSQIPEVTEEKEKYVSQTVPTGSSDYSKINNIYDFAGNVYEYTLESNDRSRTFRGGIYGHEYAPDLNYTSVSYRVATESFFDKNPYGLQNVGSRAILIIK